MSAIRLLILGVLMRSAQPTHGYDIRRELELWNAEQWANVAYGSIYFALNKMAEEELVEEELFSAGSRVAARVMVRGTNTGTFMGRAPSGRAFAAATVGMFRIEDEQIIEHWGVFDQLAMMTQLGLFGATT